MNVVNTFPIFAVTCFFIAHLRINFNGFTTTITAYFIQNIFLTNYCFNTEFFHKRSPLLMRIIFKFHEFLLKFLKTFFIAFFLRSEEHTSELQSRENLVCRLLLEKKKKKKNTN